MNIPALQKTIRELELEPPDLEEVFLRVMARH